MLLTGHVDTAAAGTSSRPAATTWSERSRLADGAAATLAVETNVDTRDAARAFMCDIRLDLLRSFVVLAEELNFTRAANQLHLSQPGMSRRVLMLERAAGRTLIERSTRPAELTPAGRALLPHVKAILAAAALAVDALTGIPAQSQVSPEPPVDIR
jgi:DNA-binding MarR family transcriptional regulator